MSLRFSDRDPGSVFLERRANPAAPSCLDRKRCSDPPPFADKYQGNPQLNSRSTYCMYMHDAVRGDRRGAEREGWMRRVGGDLEVFGISNILQMLSSAESHGLLTIAKGSAKKVIQFLPGGIRLVSGVRRTNPLGEV